MQLSLFDNGTVATSSLDSSLGPPRHHPYDGEPVEITHSHLVEIVDDVQKNARVRTLTPDHLDRFLAVWQETRQKADDSGWHPKWVELRIDGGTVRRSHSPGAPVTILQYSYGYLRARRGTADRADDPTAPGEARIQVFRPSETTATDLPEALGLEEFERHWQMVRTKKHYQSQLDLASLLRTPQSVSLR